MPLKLPKSEFDFTGLILSILSINVKLASDGIDPLESNIDLQDKQDLDQGS